MSLISTKTGSSLRIAPDQGTSLPIEIWQIILRHLKARDLCHICCVCQQWRDVMLYVDSTRWKELYSLCTDWKHPNWPLDTTIEPSSWKDAYRDQYLANRFWQNGSKDFQYMTCLTVLKRTKMKRVINVGPGEEHESLRSALNVANDYDQICVHPGIYDEQFEMSSKIPFEIIGCGELGSVILVVCIEQIATTGRLNNLVLRAPWFTSFILKIRSGFIQIDNCILEDGMLYIQNPGSCHVRFSSFRHASIILQHVNASIIENCEFCQSDTADIIVEGHVKEEKNWTFSYLQRLTERFVDAIIETNSESIEMSQTYESDDKVSNISDIMEDNRDSCHVMNGMIEKMSSVGDWVKSNPIDYRHGGSAEDESSQESISDVLQDLDSITDPGMPNISYLNNKLSDVKPLKFDLRKNSAPFGLLQQIKGCLIHHCRMTYSKGGVMVSLQGEAIILECDISNVSYGIRCIQNAQVTILKNKIHHCRTSGIFMRLASQGLIAGNDIYCNLEAGIDVRKNADPVIQYNKIHNGKRSGIVVLGSGRGHIQFNDIYENKEAGIYVLYGGNPLISGNNIYNGQAAGIAVNEGGKGLITENNITCNQWGGIDIRHDANPIIQDNLISNGSGDGIVIGERGIGCLQNNVISGNAGCGIWIMNGNKPYLNGNQISCNGDCGIMLVDKSVSIQSNYTKYMITNMSF
ncbi:hypothetical protein LOTGIDRAFT_122523 [Lottia gigantea]|uniref:F-box domain-containing protein n=1 Tax=Lottia gigantea TaxID=225164 RepID=V4A7U2_LOTGI|nr:hypothetical protein LOTGIDRAFT_122523 [Lottia gigantea]ESO91105.1 hypothetical protein LOTGIDRAFT_122523 [Lottia gigantea]